MVITSRIAYFTLKGFFSEMRKYPEARENYRMEAIMFFESLPRDIRDVLYQDYKIEYLTICDYGKDTPIEVRASLNNKFMLRQQEKLDSIWKE